MKLTLCFSLCVAATASANIIFKHVDIFCTSSAKTNKCLQGQTCNTDLSLCVAPTNKLKSNPKSHSIAVHRSTAFFTRAVAPVSTDGSCGSKNGGTVCDPHSTVYNGGCCSQYGWCGNTDAYCLPSNNCQSGCAGTSGTARTVAPFSTDGTCGSQNGGTICDPTSTSYTGGCCSQYGWCGNTDAHCLPSNKCQSGCTAPAVTSPTAPRSDGQCGKAFGGATCDPSGPYGGCCSQYGYCGSTPGHCLVANGCQNGCTASTSTAPLVSSVTSGVAATSEPVIAPVSTGGPTATGPITTDGTCGSSNGNSVCGTWPQGSCCSMYGFCGSTSAHCGEGCQSGPCLSSPNQPPPGAKAAPAASNPGSFSVVGQAGVPAMHAALMPNGRVIFLDKVENYTQLKLPNGQYAYSSEYNPADNTVVPLAYKTNAFCSGGAFLPDGRVISVGGNDDLAWLDPTVTQGFDAIRYLGRSPSDNSLNGQNWSEPGNKLASRRWYATVQTMPDGTMFVASGSLNGLDPTVLSNNNPTYEILSPTAVTQGKSINLDILVKNQPYYMYPFIHLLSDGSLFIFASKSADQFSVGTNAVIRQYPDLPGMYRTYPNTGGSVLLPSNSRNKWSSDIIICGGGAYQDITSPTDPSCGRISPLSVNPAWEMDSMPEGRGMVEGTLLPDGTVLWLNGGQLGAQGFGLCADPAFEGLLYDPTKALGARWSRLASTNIPRLYHSIAVLLLDGTIMVAGSNPVQMPVLVPDAENPYVTEFRVENYVPPYLQGTNASKRPTNIILSSKKLTPNGSTFKVSFTAPTGAQAVSVVLYHGGFVTHSLHMGARMMQLDTSGWTAGGGAKTVTVTMPPNNNVAPPGPYVAYVLCDGIPGIGQFVSVA